MSKSNNIFPLTVALLCGVIGLTSCNSATMPTNGNNSVTVTNGSNTSNIATPAAATKTETTSTHDKIGVPECDEYLEKYDACLPKLSEIERTGVKKGLDMYRKAWKEAAADPKNKSDLAKGCQEILEITKETTRTYGCTW